MLTNTAIMVLFVEDPNIVREREKYEGKMLGTIFKFFLKDMLAKKVGAVCGLDTCLPIFFIMIEYFKHFKCLSMKCFQKGK